MKIIKSIIVITLVICLLASGFSVGINNQSKIEISETRAGQGTLRVEHYKTVNSLNPFTTGIDLSNPQHVYMPNMYETLVKFAPNGTIMPCLAESWEVSSDGLTWTFNLRQNVKFHDDNTNLDAQTVKDSIEKAIQNNTLGSQTGIAEMWSDLNDSDGNPSNNGIDGIVVVDSDTIQLITDFPAPMDRIAAAPAGAYIVSSSASGFDTASYGTGPWQLKEYNNPHLILERFDNYWGGWNDYQYDEIDIHYNYAEIYHSDGGATAIKNDDADLAYIRPFDAPDIVDNYGSSLKVSAKPTSYTYTLFYNQNSETDAEDTANGEDVMADANFRRALSYAINYEQVVEDGCEGYGQQTKGPMTHWVYPHNDTLFQYDYNITKAREILADAGYPNNETGNDYGWVTLRLLYNNDNEISYRLSRPDNAIVQSLELLGIDVLVKDTPSPFRETQGDYDMYLGLFWSTVHTGYNRLMTQFGANDSAFNFAYYENQTFRDLCAAGYENDSINQGLSEQYYYEAQKMLIDDAVAAFLLEDSDSFAMKNEIMGFESNPYYPRVVFFYDLMKDVSLDIQHSPRKYGAVNGTIDLIATVTGSPAINEVVLNYIDVHNSFHSVEMSSTGNDYSYSIPAQDTTGNITYYIWAINDVGTKISTDNYVIEVAGDEDSDQLPDNWEKQYNDPANGIYLYWYDANSDGLGVDDTYEDYDDDGLNNLQELWNSTDPGNPDTDGDNLTDGEEVNTYGTDPTNADTDGDTLTDSEEINIYKTDPTKKDTEDDGMPDDWEVQYGLDPLSDDANKDKDDDGYTNLEEYENGWDPTDPNDPNPQRLPILLIVITIGAILFITSVVYKKVKKPEQKKIEKEMAEEDIDELTFY